MKRLASILLGSAIVLAGLAFVFRDAILTAIARRVVDERMNANAVASLRAKHPDAMHVVLCGTGAPLPDPGRAGPCTAIATKTKLFVVDVGSGAARELLWLGFRLGEVDAVLLTHFHSDHIDGLGELLLQRWAGGRQEPVPVHGPEGVERVVEGFDEAYAQDKGYRVAHHGPEIMPPPGHGGTAKPFAMPREGEAVTVLDEDGVKVTAFRVAHAPVEAAVGYRFESGGRSVVVSGDTAKSANLARFAEGADLLVHEGLAPELVGMMTEAAEKGGRPSVAKITRDILGYHTAPVEAAAIARDAKVGMLVFTHVIPPLPNAAVEALFLRGVDEVYAGPVVAGRDGMTFSLPAGTSAIERGKL